MIVVQPLNCLNSELRLSLTDLAGRFSSDEMVKRRLVERAINVVCDEPRLLDRLPMRKALFRVMVVIVREEIGFAPRQR
jgi:hypothetical protein